MANSDEPKKTNGQNIEQPSRRKFLINAGYAIGGVVVGGAVGSLFRKPNKTQQTEPAPPSGTGEETTVPKNYNRALMFFSQDQFAIANAAAERIYPADDIGPGAAALGVAFFIDHQLAGDWGFNSREYMSPPFYTGEKTQGYQGRLRRREMFEIGLQEIENYSQTQKSKKFVKLAPEEQDEVLKAFESDSVKLTTISASGFFKTLRSATIEGVYSDPLYGGNMDMNGWKMRNYPGNQMSYTDIIEKDFTKIEPSSLQDHMSAH
ncbi:gluconate 2-dehydrogenase subunit 3 family protein [Cohnella endophytica]|uniref:gluconate 2-dehydrogenase subunit 3 family protein n=1 Tax=Cohnella endophytica TaxID=2419778 RepID=UPI001F2F6BB4|nr:gluconate 2-dehydrogenase subunit 3 family protein [Cohnella endophytica]